MEEENQLSVWENIYKQGGRIFQEPLGEVVSLVPLLKSLMCSKILDLGCGNGRHTIYLAGLGFQLYGTDSSPTGLALAHSGLRMAGLEASLLVSDFRQPIPFQSAVFDAIITTRVLHHARLSEIELAAAEVSRIARVGGIILYASPIGWHKEGSFEEIEPQTYLPLEGREKGLPHHIFKLDEIQKLFSGFEKLALFTVDEKLGFFIGKRRA
jgi:SAM-dependent methyltransferase